MSSDTAEHLKQMITRVQVLAAASEWDQAVILLDEIIALRPDDANLWYNKGVALDRLHRPNDATVALEEAVRINPDHTKAISTLEKLQAQAHPVEPPSVYEYPAPEALPPLRVEAEAPPPLESEAEAPPPLVEPEADPGFIAYKPSADIEAPVVDQPKQEFINVGSTGETSTQRIPETQPPIQRPPATIELAHGSTILAKHSIYVEGTPPLLRRTYLPDETNEDHCDLTYTHRRISGAYCRLVVADCPNVDINTYTRWFLATEKLSNIILNSSVDLAGELEMHGIVFAGHDGWSEFDILGVLRDAGKCIRIYGRIRGGKPDDLASFVNLASRIHLLPADYTIEPNPSAEPAALISPEHAVFGRSEAYSIIIPPTGWQVNSSNVHSAESESFDLSANNLDKSAHVYVRAFPVDGVAVDLNDTATGWIMELYKSAMSLAVYELRDTSVDGRYAVLADLVYRRGDGTTHYVLICFTASKRMLCIIDCDILENAPRQMAGVIVRSFKFGGPSECPQRAAISDMPGREAADDDDLDDALLSGLPESHGVVLKTTYGLFIASALLSILYVAGMRSPGVKLAWWICAMLGALSGATCGVVWSFCYKKPHFQTIAHIASYSSFRWRSWLPAAAGAVLLCLGLSVWLVWPTALLLLCGGVVYLIFHRSPGAILDTDRVLVAAATLPEHYVAEAHNVPQLLLFDDLQDTGALRPIDSAEHSDFANPADLADADVRCIVCGGMQRADSKMADCVLCGEHVCKACESGVEDAVVCTNCHRVGAVCEDCGTYYRDRLSLLSCAGCGDHFCEKCSTVRELPGAKLIVPDDMFHTVVVDMIRPYVHDTGKQNDWVIICRLCEADSESVLNAGTAQSNAARHFKHEMRLVNVAAGAADAQEASREPVAGQE